MDDDTPHLTTDHVAVPHRVEPLAHGERGVVATAPIARGTVCVVFGGYVTHADRFVELPAERQRHSVQIGDDLYLVCGERLTDGDFVNHSCDPTLGFAGEITLVALRDIDVGEALTFDYATADSSAYDEFECECGEPSCRGKVTGEDWMKPELQRRYAGHFSPYLQRRIDSLPER